jgi:alpha-glucosidase
MGYEAYARSFADGDGDGIGDLAGIAAHVGHLAWLGVDALWITPFFRSPGFDHGYDVSDYTDVDPIHGTLDDFDTLVAAAHGVGIKVIVDVVPNHTSSLHPWFLAALSDPHGPYRDYYIWRDPAPGGGHPNNWVSHFGGPAWTLDPVSGQYYCHLFLPEQPDLNWRNPSVADEFDAILRFWCDRGADGFRIDVAHALYKDEQFRDNPLIREPEQLTDPGEIFQSFEHRYDLDQDETVDVYRRWKRIVAPYQGILVGEVGTSDPVRISRYVADGALDTLFYLKPVWMTWQPLVLLDRLRAVHELNPERISWVVDNHDSSRSVSRFGGGEVGAHRSMAVFTLMASLGGMPFLYQGQELGIGDGIIAPEHLADPVATRNVGAAGRDGCRTVMPWNDGIANGFSTTSDCWLPAEDRPLEETVAGQIADPASWLHRYRALVAYRKATPALWTGEATWMDTPSGAVGALRRHGAVTIANLADETVTVELPPGLWSLGFASRALGETEATGSIQVPAQTAVILEPA